MTYRERTIVALLENYHELVDPKASGKGGDRGIGIMMMPSTYTPSVKELERLLAEMRQAPQRAVHRGHPLGRLRFHLVAWYVDVERVGSWHPLRVKRGRTKVPAGQEILRDEEGRYVPAVRVERVHRDARARRKLAEIGVEWLAERWGLRTEPMLPPEFTHLVGR